jgi:hypothetical protein
MLFQHRSFEGQGIGSSATTASTPAISSIQKIRQFQRRCTTPRDFDLRWDERNFLPLRLQHLRGRFVNGELVVLPRAFDPLEEWKTGINRFRGLYEN